MIVKQAWAWWRALCALCLCGAAFSFVFVFACDDGGGDGDGDTDVDGDTDGDTDGDGDGDLPGWTTTVVAADNVGRFSSIDVAANGTVGVAFFGFESRNDGTCEEIDTDPPRSLFPLYWSQLAGGDGDWQTELVAEPLHLTAPSGVSFRFAPDGTPAVGMFGGEPFDVLCSSNDAVYGSRSGGTWTFEAAAVMSADTPLPADATCDPAAAGNGYTVGEWPALAFDSAGNPAILHRDTHNGGMQSIDIRTADAEVAYRQGGWNRFMMDCGDGGGRDNAAVFDSEDRFVGMHRITLESHIDDRHGVWVHRQEADGTVLQVRLANGMTATTESSLTAGSDSYIAAAYFDSGEQHLFVAELEDTVRFADASSWAQEELGDNSYNEGHYPSIALSPSGTLAVAYYRCAQTGEELCDPTHDALVFAWRTGSGTWRTEIVDEGAAGHCGTYTSLAFGPDGRAWISYTCVRHVAGSEFSSELKVATRRAL